MFTEKEHNTIVLQKRQNDIQKRMRVSDGCAYITHISRE